MNCVIRTCVALIFIMLFCNGVYKVQGNDAYFNIYTCIKNIINSTKIPKAHINDVKYIINHLLTSTNIMKENMQNNNDIKNYVNDISDNIVYINKQTFKSISYFCRTDGGLKGEAYYECLKNLKRDLRLFKDRVHTRDIIKNFMTREATPFHNSMEVGETSNANISVGATPFHNSMEVGETSNANISVDLPQINEHDFMGLNEKSDANDDELQQITEIDFLGVHDRPDANDDGVDPLFKMYKDHIIDTATSDTTNIENLYSILEFCVIWHSPWIYILKLSMLRQKKDNMEEVLHNYIVAIFNLIMTDKFID